MEMEELVSPMGKKGIGVDIKEVEVEVEEDDVSNVDSTYEVVTVDDIEEIDGKELFPLLQGLDWVFVIVFL